jgi:CheY-like chemotaxis protein/signal transduction histidine kinase/HAMP domain-containing protein
MTTPAPHLKPTAVPKTGLSGRISALWNFETADPKARDAFRVAVVIAIAGFGSLPLYIFIVVQTGAWQMALITCLNAVIGAGCSVGAILSRRDQVERGMGVVIVTLLMVCVVTAALVQVGILLALLYFLVVTGAITQTLTSRAAYRAIISTLVGCVLMGLLEIYPPAFQYPAPALRPILLIFGGMMLLIFFILAARQIRSYPLHIKLVLIFMLVALIPVGAVTFAQHQTGLLVSNAAQFRTIELSLLLTAGLAGLTALGVAQFVAGPIERLTVIAETVFAGDLSAQARVESGDEVGKLALTFNNTTTRLRQTLEGLEKRVEERTEALSRHALQLQAATEVSRVVSSMLDADELIRQAVNLVRDHFDLYYVGLFLLDEQRRFAVLDAGTGEAGRQMLANAHKLEVGDDSMIGWCITHKQARIALDTDKEAVRFKNPLLPGTRSELALPLTSQGQVIGAMTAQSTQESAFSLEDITILQTLADQMANGIEKARLYEQVQQRAIELYEARDAADIAKEDAENARMAAEEANRSLAAQMWQTTGQALLNEKMRGEQDVPTLANSVIEQLCQYLAAQVGTLYVLEGSLLKLAGGYAYTRRSNFPDQFQIGEGLVGQAAREKKTCAVHIPDDYISIISPSLGELLPRTVLALPFTYDGQVIGVIEIGALTEFTTAQMEFLNSALESIAIAFSTAQARKQVNELLTQTRQQAEELQAQEEELRATNEELETQTESLRASETRLKANQTALEAANADLEEKTQILQEQQTVLDHQNRDLREAQQELERKATELAATSKYKSEFLANMSHELRTPLNSLLILSGMLAKNEGGNLTPTQQESAQIIYASGADLLQLINDILDLSKVEAGHMTFNFEPMSFASLVQNMHLQFEHVAGQKSLQFEIGLAAGLSESITTDQQRVEQVLKNLLSNAFKFTEQGVVQLKIEPAGEMIALRVHDTGIGMTPEQQQHVFEAFQQADGSINRKYGGTGLGLTISREMTAKLGGRIELESEPGKGSLFTLYLPLYHPEGEAESTPAPASVPITARQVFGVSAQTNAEERQSAPPEKISTEAVVLSKPAPFVDDDRDQIQKGDKVLLVIEDDPKFAKVLFGYAHKKNFKCVLAGDGESGLKLATVHHPDAILLDLNLPGMNGWEVLDALKGDAGLRHIPVHILSDVDQTMDAYKRGALGFLSKPINREQLDGVFSTIGEFLLRDIKTLLIVEDDNVLRHSVRQLLGGGDVKISEAARGEAALALLREARFDCMILDLTLPDMTGFELLNKINQDKTVSKCPVIVYTGKALSEEENAELLKYASSVIIKGVKSPERLLDETALFLHRVVADMPAEKQDTIHRLHDRDAVFSGKHVLVVDDNVRNAFALSRLLSDKNLRVSIARSGEKALEMLETIADIDLVLMDIMMPEMDGYEAMQRVRAQSKFKNLPILALTAKAMKGDLEKCIAAGANDYLSKPIDVDRLFSMLRVWLYR